MLEEALRDRGFQARRSLDRFPEPAFLVSAEAPDGAGPGPQTWTEGADVDVRLGSLAEARAGGPVEVGEPSAADAYSPYTIWALDTEPLPVVRDRVLQTLEWSGWFRGTEGEGYSDEETRMIEERLAALGYM
jgi:hypothetical protein